MSRDAVVDAAAAAAWLGWDGDRAAALEGLNIEATLFEAAGARSDDHHDDAASGLPGSRLRPGQPLCRGHECSAHVTVRRAADGAVLSSTRDVVDGAVTGGADEPYCAQLGTGGCVPGVEILLAGMCVGQRAVAILPARLVAPGPSPGPEWTPAAREGCPVELCRPDRLGLRPDEGVEVDVEVLSARVSLPPAPPRSVMEGAQSRREEEDRRRFLEEEAPPPWAVRVRESRTALAEADALRRAGSPAEAVERLNAAFAGLMYTSDEAKWRPATPEEGAAAGRARGALHSCRAACYLKTGDLESAAWDGRRAVEALGGERVALLRLAAARVRWAREGLVGSGAGSGAGRGGSGRRAGGRFDPERAAVAVLLAGRCLLRAEASAAAGAGEGGATAGGGAAAVPDGVGASPALLAASAELLRWARWQSGAAEAGGAAPIAPADGDGWEEGVAVDEMGRPRSGDDVGALRRLTRSLGAGAWAGAEALGMRAGTPAALWGQARAVVRALVEELRAADRQRAAAFGSAFRSAPLESPGCGSEPARPAEDEDDDDMPPLEE